MIGIRRKQLKCSFCGKDETQVARLLGGPGVHICDDCVGSCNRILERDKSAAVEIGDDPLLRSLPACEAAVEAARDVLQERVNELRRRGVSWELIARALGVSRQAAWERFS